jgi:predicted DNA-binding protein
MDQLVGIPNKVEMYVQEAIQKYLEDMDMDSEVAQAILNYFETHDMSEIIGTAVTDAIANLG